MQVPVPTDVTVVGNGGLVFAGFAPILARMRVEAGVRGGMKLPWASTQPSAAAGAEGSDITVSTLVLSNAEFLPKSIASAYELTSSLEASDDGTFMSLIDLAIRSVVSEQLVSQVLVGGGTDEISGIWGLTGVCRTSITGRKANSTAKMPWTCSTPSVWPTPTAVRR